MAEFKFGESVHLAGYKCGCYHQHGETVEFRGLDWTWRDRAEVFTCRGSATVELSRLSKIPNSHEVGDRVWVKSPRGVEVLGTVVGRWICPDGQWNYRVEHGSPWHGADQTITTREIRAQEKEEVA